MRGEERISLAAGSGGTSMCAAAAGSELL